MKKRDCSQFLKIWLFIISFTGIMNQKSDPNKAQYQIL